MYIDNVKYNNSQEIVIGKTLKISKKIVNHRANWIRHQKETSDFNVEPSHISSKLRVQVPWPSSSAKLVPP